MLKQETNKNKKNSTSSFQAWVIKQPQIASFLLKKKNQGLVKALWYFRFAVLGLFCIVVGVPAISAFEAHVVNVTATLKQVDPPVLTPPGNNMAWDNTNGGSNLSGSINIVMSDSDPDATNIYYTFATGTVTTGFVADPVCGQTGPNGGGGDKTLPQQLTINTSSVVKAIACDNTNTVHSVVNVKVFAFGSPVTGLVINEFLPNATSTPGGNQGVPNGHFSGNGGEWVELYNNATTTYNLTGYILYDGFVPTPVLATSSWTTDTDFLSGILNNVSVSGSGVAANVKLNPSAISGSIEIVTDAGLGNKGHWQNLISNTNVDNGDSSNFICFAVATSNDGLSYSSYANLPNCALNNTGASTISNNNIYLTIPDSRFLKWKATMSRKTLANVVALEDVSLSYSVINNNGYHELPIIPANTNTGNVFILPNSFLLVYRDGNAAFELNSSQNSVKLYNGHVYNGATLIDSHAYSLSGPIAVNKSFARVPDGTTNWIDPCPTPGTPNVKNECQIGNNIQPTVESASTSIPDNVNASSTDTSDNNATTTSGDSTTTLNNLTSPPSPDLLPPLVIPNLENATTSEQTLNSNPPPAPEATTTP